MKIDLSPEEALSIYNGQQLAFIGDSVHSLYTRLTVLQEGLGQKASHLRTVDKVNANAQANSLGIIYSQLTPQEKEVVKKGRNAHGRKTVPRSATIAKYSASTGFEALLGFLYLTGQTERLESLLLSLLQKENSDKK